MPTTLAHAVVGLAAEKAQPARFFPSTLAELAMVAVLANLPDIDFLPGLLVGDPGRFHHGPTHTLLAAVVAGIVVGLVWWRVRGRFWPFAALAFALYASHLLADCVVYDRGQTGLALLRPFIDRPISIYVPIPERVDGMFGFIRGQSAGSFMDSYFSWRGAAAMLLEALLYAPLLLLAWGGRTAARAAGRRGRRTGRRGTGSSP